LSEEEITRQRVDEIRELLKNKTHQELVNFVKGVISSEGLIIYAAKGPFSEGFIPDVITNIDGTRNGWVLIDVINNQESVLRDIAGLLVVKEERGDRVRAILCAASHNVEGVRFMRAFLKQYPEVDPFRIEEIRAVIRVLRKLKESQKLE